MKELLERLAELNISLVARDAQLDIYDPDEALTDELLSGIAENKSAILSLLKQVNVEYKYVDIPVSAKKEHYKLSSGQKRLFFLHEFDRNSLAYNMPQVVKLQGEIDNERLNDTFRKLITRHESLRTYFTLENGTPVQKIASKVDFEIEYFETDESGADEVIKNFIRPFSLDKAPLLRVGLAALSAGEHLLLVDMHHIITDGVSHEVLIKDFTALYSGQSLKELRLQYKDYAEWQQSAAQQEEISRQKKFWLQQFPEAPVALELPADHARPKMKTHAGSIENFSLSREESSRLKSIAESEGATLFMAVLSIYNILLSKLSGQEDVVIGTAVAGRQHAGLQGIVGMFVNTLPLRNHPAGNLGFREFLAGVKDVTLAAFDNQEYQYEELIEVLQVERDTSRNPLFDVVFAYQNFEKASLEVPGLSLSSFHNTNTVSKFDLTMVASEMEGQLHFTLEYSTALFEAATIRRFISYFRNIVAAITANADVKIADIEVVQGEEKQYLLQLLNSLDADYPRQQTITSIFEERAAAYPGNIALEFEGSQLTYAELNSRCNRLARHLRAAGIGRDTIVGLLTGRTLETVTGMLAILKAGGAYLPIDTDYPQERIDYMINDSGLRYLLTTQEQVVSQPQVQVIRFGDEAGTEADSNLEHINQPQDLCYIIYTSGTTGNPKGVMIEHRNVVRLLFNDKFQFDFGAQDVWTMFHSHCFDFSVWEIYGALLYGGKVVIIPKMVSRDPVRFLQLLQEKAVTVLNQTPSAFYNLIEAALDGEQPTLHLRYVIFGGEALKPARLKEWHQRYPTTRLINMFGITETTVHVTFKEIGSYEIAHNISNIGKPIPTLSMYVLDKYTRLVPRGVKGELFVGGEGVARGYLNRAALTSQRFIVNPYNPQERLYRAGDLARLLPTGELEYLGRMDNQVKIRGFRIELGEVESHLLKHLDAAEVIVLAKQDADGNTALCAYIVQKEPLSVAEMRSRLLAVLPDYLVPAYFVVLDKIPLTPNGKVDKQQLPEPDADTADQYVAPSTETEEKLVSIWAEVLKLKEIGVTANFFSIGGDSMKAIRLVNAVNKKLNVQVRIPDLFMNPTIRSFATHISTSGMEAFANRLAIEQQIKEELEEKKTQFLLSHTNIDSDNVEDVFPASDIQSGMIFHSIKDPGIYHDQMVHLMPYPDIDHDTLMHALQLIVNKHAILRTAFYQWDNELLQVVFRNVKPNVAHYDISDKSEKEQFSIITRFISDDKKVPIEIGRPGLWRFITFALGKDAYCVCFICHHAIIDGWSDASFNTELNNTFLALQKDPGFTPAPLKCSYKDYVIQQLAAARDGEAAAFWQKELSGYSRFSFGQSDDAGIFKTVAGTLPEELQVQLKAKAKQWDISTKNLYVSAYLYALNMFSYDDDITAGLIVNNRPALEDGDKVLGCFLNTLPVRMQMPGNSTWKEYVRSVNEKLTGLKKYDNISLSKIVDIIKEPSGSQNPITDVIFNYIDFHVYDDFKVGELSKQQGWAEENNFTGMGQVQDNYLFSLDIDETGGESNYYVSYNTGFVREEHVMLYIDYFRRILELVALDADRPLNKRSVVADGDFAKLIYDYNDTATSYPQHKTIVDLFEEQVRRAPGNIALIHGDTELTYEALNAKANQLAHYLKRRGVGEQHIVAMMIDRSVEMIIAIIGILKTGAAYLPLEVSRQQERITDMLRDSKPAFLLTEGDNVTAYSLFNTIDIRDSDITSEEKHNLGLPLSPSGLAYIIYTSGSTGKPKGVLIRHQAVVNILSSRNKDFRIQESERILQTSSIAFDASVEQVWLALMNGAALVLINKDVLLDGQLFNEYIINHRVTHIDTTPSFLESTKLDKRNTVKRIAAGGEECSVSLAARLIEDYEFYNEYGPTETTIVSIATLVTKDHVEIGSIPVGRPIGNTTVYILDKHAEWLPPGIKGELYIAGDGLAAGYLNDEELTQKKFVNNPFVPGTRMYRTGDLAMWLPDRTISYLGRIDEQVKIRGFRVETGEIETRLAAHAQVGQAVVLVKEKAGEKYLVAYYTSEEEIDTAGLRTFVAERLPDYMVPSYYVHLDTIPMTQNGKLDRRALPEPTLVKGHDYTAPSNDLERRLAEIWGTVLKMDADSISVTSNFFEIGGHSLRATQLINNIARDLEVNVPLRAVFTHQTIRGLADFISKAAKDEFISIKNETRRSHYMLSSAQKRMYFLYEFDKDSTAYNMPQVMRLEGSVDKDRLDRTFRELIKRHESLRTSFMLLNGEPVQMVADEIEFEIAHFSASEEEAPALIQKFVQPFALHKAPLIRVGLIELTGTEYLLMVDMHHIITDGVSQGLLVRDFKALYNNNPLPPLRLQYKDYAEWQQSDKQRELINSQKEFWLQQFAELPPVLDLPLDFPRPAVKDHTGDYVDFGLTVEETKKLRAIAEAEGITLFMAVLAIYNILLSKISGQEDIVVGTPVAGRQHADVENMVGMFVNTLPLRNYPKAELRFRELLLNIRSGTLAAFENQGYQYEEMIDALKVERTMNRNPIFDTSFTYLNFEATELEIPGIRLHPYEIGHALAKFDLTLGAAEFNEQILFSIVYSTALFRKETITRFAEYFHRIVTAVIADADTRIADISLLSAPDRHRILVEYNNTAAAFPADKTLTALFEEQVKNTPLNTAVIHNDRSMTYAVLNEKANQLAHHLVNSGVKPGAIVAVVVDRSPELIIGILAILKAGSTYLPFDTAQPAQRVRQVLQSSGASFLLTHADKLSLYRDVLPVLDITDTSIYTGDAGNPQMPMTPDHLSNIIYTSGSTGTPKGVMITHRSMVNFITGQKVFFSMGEEDRVLQFSSISFDASGEQVWTPLLSGAALVMIDKEILTDNKAFDQYLARHGVTHLHATPSFLESIELHEQPTLRRVVAGGEACKPQLAEKYSRYQFYNKYGPTETTITSIECLVTDAEKVGSTVSIGKPVNNTQVYILGPHNELLPENIKGELFIAGAGLAKGYLNDEALTKQKFVDNPFVPGEKMYRTGDMAKWLPGGNIEYLGRVDEQVKIRGFRIEVGEVESRLKEQQQVTRAVVVAKELQGEKQLVAYYVAAAPIDANELRGHLLAGLPDYMVPAHYVHMHELPLTASGKINRRALPEPEMLDDQGHIAAVGPVEEKLVQLWSEILKVPAERIGMHSNFFDLGGHSLRTTVLANRILKEFQVEVPLKEIFSNQTISSLAAYIVQADKSGYVAIGKAPVKSYYQLSSAQRRLFFLYQFDRSSLAYNMPQVARLQGTLDKERLHQAFQSLVARHESLRTYFEVVGGEPVQKIAPQVTFELEEYEGEEVDMLVQQFIRPFDLRHAPLIRAGIVRLPGNEHLLMIDTHHIIKDGVSSGVLNRDLVALYNNEQLQELKLQYKDYAEWQQLPAQQQKIAKQREFWINEYAEEPARLELTTDFPRPLILGQEGGTVSFELSEAQTSALKDIAAKEGATLFMVMFSLYNVLLSRLSNQEDVVVGIPTAGRQHADLDNVIGMFVNTLPMRSYPRKKLSFREFVSRVKEGTLAGFDNQAYPYEALIDELKIVRDTSRNPLFDTIFVYQNFEDVTLQMPGLTFTPYDIGHDIAKFDLTLSVAEQQSKLSLNLGYSKDLFRQETIERFVAYFKRITDAVAANAGIRLADIELLSQAEQDVIVHTFNDTRIEYPLHKTVMHLFDEQVERTPANVAVITGDHVLTYEGLKESSERMAAYLVQVKGVKPGALVGVLMEREEQLLPVIFGILKAGAAYVPIDPAYPANRVLSIVEDSQLTLMVSRKKHLQGLDELACKKLTLDKEIELINAQAPLVSPVQVEPDSLAYVIYTSGSTGRPKGVMVAHRSLTNIICCLQSMYPLGENDRYLFKTTYTFDVSVAEIFGWFPGGGSISLLEQGAAGDPFRILRAIERDRITHMNFVPSMFAIFVEALETMAEVELSSLRYIFLAGEALPAELVKRFRALNSSVRLENIYGPTEATIYACGYSIGDAVNPSGIPIGKPLHNTRLYVVDSHYKLQPVGVPGELCIAGDGLAKGYLNNEALTNDKFIVHAGLNERLYKTGDLVKWLPDGNIDYLGRIDAQVKIRGFRIELSEIESLLNAHAAISQAVVIARERPGDKYLVAYYVSAAAIESRELKAFLSGKLPEYMLPAYFVHLQQMPLTPSGKVNRKLLPEPEVGEGRVYVAPVGRVEEKLAEIWSEVLELPRDHVSVDANFFEMGGHSLKATKLLFRIQRQFRADVSLLDVFRFPTIRQFAARLEEVKDVAKESNDLLIRLKHDPDARNNFFFIHEGSGDVQGYTSFAGLMKGFNCWGIRSVTLRENIPLNIELDEMAAQYVEAIRSVQPKGPYYIAGWSYGGVISFETVRQLEAAGEKVALLMMIDSQFPVTESRSGYTLDTVFTVEDDRQLLYSALGTEPAELRDAKTMKELWERSFAFLEKGGEGLVKIKNMIPGSIRAILPHVDEIGIEDLVAYVNSIRTIERTVIRYHPTVKVQARMLYIRALDTTLDLRSMSQYFLQAPEMLPVEGSHFTILMPPRAERVANEVLDRLPALVHGRQSVPGKEARGSVHAGM